MSKSKKIDLNIIQETHSYELLNGDIPFSKTGRLWFKITPILIGVLVAVIILYFGATFLYSGWSDGVTGYEVLKRENATRIFWFGQLSMCFIIFVAYRAKPKRLLLKNEQLYWIKTDQSQFKFDPATLIYTRNRFADQNVCVRLNKGQNSLYDPDVFNEQIKPILRQGKNVKWWGLWGHQVRNNPIIVATYILGYSAVMLIYIVVRT